MTKNQNGENQEQELLERSSFYREMLAERRAIDRHQCLESRELGRDIGFELAMLHWIRKHRDSWRDNLRERAVRTGEDPVR